MKPATSPTIIINNVWSRISGVRDLHLVDRLDHELSYFVEGYQFTRAYKQGYWDKELQRFRHWDGRRHMLNQSMVFPTGLLQRVLAFFKAHRVDIEIDDRRQFPEEQRPLKIRKYTPRPYQEEAVEAVMKAGRGMVRIGTGGGKTLVSAIFAARHNLPTMVYVVGKDLLHQFHREFCDILGKEHVGIIGDGLCDIRRINICSVWTAVKSFDLKLKVSLDDEDWSPETVALEGETKNAIRNAVQGAFVAVFDEAHFLACDTIQSIFKASKNCCYIMAMSGTPWRDDGADLLLESVCGPRVFDMSASDLIDDGWLVPPRIAFVEIPALPEALPKNWKTVYSRYVVHNEIRNRAIVDAAKTLVGMGRKVLILVRSLKHGKNLVDMADDLSMFFVNGRLDSRLRADAKERFEAGGIQCLVASSVFDIGIDLPSLDALIMAGGGKSTVRVLQRIGRVIRAFDGKSDAIVMDLLDNARYLDRHSSIRLALYEAERRFQVRLPQGFDRRRLKKAHIKESIKRQ